MRLSGVGVANLLLLNNNWGTVRCGLPHLTVPHLTVELSNIQRNAVRPAISATAGLLVQQTEQESLANAKVSARQPCTSKTDFDMK